MNHPLDPNQEYGAFTEPAGHGYSRRLAAGLAVGLFVAAMGCGGDQPPQKPAPPKPAAAKAPEAAAQSPDVGKSAEAVTVAPTLYVYNPEERRDPFRSILVTSETAKTLESLPPLLQTEIGELRLIGIVWGGFGYSAMVQTPDGKGYTIRVGTPVGPNKGVVRHITDRYLTIEEKYTDIFGEKKVREVKLDLHPQKEGSE